MPKLRALPAAKLMAMPPGQAVVVTDPELPGFTMTVPAGVQIIGWDGQPNSQVAVTAVPPDGLPLPPLALELFGEAAFSLPECGWRGSWMAFSDQRTEMPVIHGRRRMKIGDLGPDFLSNARSQSWPTAHIFGGTTGNELDKPPSTGNACPFTYDASSDAKNNAT